MNIIRTILFGFAAVCFYFFQTKAWGFMTSPETPELQRYFVLAISIVFVILITIGLIYSLLEGKRKDENTTNGTMVRKRRNKSDD